MGDVKNFLYFLGHICHKHEKIKSRIYILAILFLRSAVRYTVRCESKLAPLTKRN